MRQLDYNKIQQVLNMAPLCTGMLIDGAGDEAHYCSQGALLRGAGISQEKIQEYQQALQPPPYVPSANRDKDMAAFSAEILKANKRRAEVNREIEAILLEEYGLPKGYTEQIPGWNDNEDGLDEEIDESDEQFEERNRAWSGLTPAQRVLQALQGRYGLTSTGEGTTVSHDNDGQTPGEEASATGVHDRAHADAAEAPDDPGRLGEGDSRRSPDGWTVGSGPHGQVPCAATIHGDLAFADMG